MNGLIGRDGLEKTLVISAARRKTEALPEEVDALALRSALEHRTGGNLDLRKTAPGHLILLHAPRQLLEKHIGSGPVAAAEVELEDARKPVLRALVPSRDRAHRRIDIDEVDALLD